MKKIQDLLAFLMIQPNETQTRIFKLAQQTAGEILGKTPGPPTHKRASTLPKDKRTERNAKRKQSKAARKRNR